MSPNTWVAVHRAELAEVVAEVHVLLLARRVGHAGEGAQTVELRRSRRTDVGRELLAVRATREVRADEAVVVVAVVRVEHEEARARVELLRDVIVCSAPKKSYAADDIALWLAGHTIWFTASAHSSM